MYLRAHLSRRARERKGRKEEGVEIGSLSLLLPVDFTSSFSFFFGPEALAYLILPSLLLVLQKQLKKSLVSSLSPRGTTTEKGGGAKDEGSGVCEQLASANLALYTPALELTLEIEPAFPEKKLKEQEEVALYR